MSFDPSTTAATTVRGGDVYLGVRLSMDCTLATARIKLKLDINFGDPVTPGPGTISLPTPLDGPPVEIRGYPIASVRAEKLSTAMQLGEANTRIRDYVNLYTLTGIHPLDFRQTRHALLITATHRGINLRPLSTAVGELAHIPSRRLSEYRAGLGIDGPDLPDDLTEVITAVTTFTDPLLQDVPRHGWSPITRQWS
jgi:hypothetical protein